MGGSMTGSGMAGGTPDPGADTARLAADTASRGMAAAAFVGATLAPLFLGAPHTPAVLPLIREFSQLDCAQTAHDWPAAVCQPDSIAPALACLQRGAREYLEQHETSCGTGEAGGVEAAGGAADAAGLAHTPLTGLLSIYRRLFEGPEQLAAPPWGSVYTDKDCVIFGSSTLELRAWMRTNGIVFDRSKREPEDHLGLLLHQLAFLAQHRPALVGDYLRLHVLTWSHHYLQLLEAAARDQAPRGQAASGFYQGLARLTDCSLESLRIMLELEVTYPRYYR